MTNHYSDTSSRLGLGCVTFGREIDQTASFALMDHALSMGINEFDTAAAYGGGVSESIVGAWLKERRLKSGQVSIATKILPPYDALNINSLVDASLKRLGMETVDLLYLHRWDATAMLDETWLVLEELIQKGKVKAFGLSNYNKKQLADTINLLEKAGSIKISYIQNNHNLAVNDITAQVKELCHQNNIRIITYSPLGAGFLTGKHVSGVQKDSRFDIMPAHQQVYFNAHAQNRLNKLLEVAARTGYSPALLALAWAVHQPGIYSVLVGGRSVNQLDLPIEALKFYAPELFTELETG